MWARQEGWSGSYSHFPRPHLIAYHLWLCHMSMLFLWYRQWVWAVVPNMVALSHYHFKFLASAGSGKKAQFPVRWLNRYSITFCTVWYICLFKSGWRWGVLAAVLPKTFQGLLINAWEGLPVLYFCMTILTFFKVLVLLAFMLYVQ